MYIWLHFTLVQIVSVSVAKNRHLKGWKWFHAGSVDIKAQGFKCAGMAIANFHAGSMDIVIVHRVNGDKRVLACNVMVTDTSKYPKHHTILTWSKDVDILPLRLAYVELDTGKAMPIGEALKGCSLILSAFPVKEVEWERESVASAVDPVYWSFDLGHRILCPVLHRMPTGSICVTGCGGERTCGRALVMGAYVVLGLLAFVSFSRGLGLSQFGFRGFLPQEVGHLYPSSPVPRSRVAPLLWGQVLYINLSTTGLHFAITYKTMYTFQKR
ncbi:hypothetical protein DFH07DRAFT_764393 [Mycena maculata]|uniref:Uncharacterized protein n=1 Tax=Mycena maculata TaxID=230809 RepID=A0AAD7KCZ0_9AGAR|nr:hypothetical protein DFH07DRAFT_764393 [Mycena maculata]